MQKLPTSRPILHTHILFRGVKINCKVSQVKQLILTGSRGMTDVHPKTLLHPLLSGSNFPYVQRVHLVEERQYMQETIKFRQS